MVLPASSLELELPGALSFQEGPCALGGEGNRSFSFDSSAEFGVESSSTLFGTADLGSCCSLVPASVRVPGTDGSKASF